MPHVTPLNESCHICIIQFEAHLSAFLPKEPPAPPILSICLFLFCVISKGAHFSTVAKTHSCYLTLIQIWCTHTYIISHMCITYIYHMSMCAYKYHMSYVYQGHISYVCAYADRHTQTKIKYRHRRNTMTQAQHGHISRWKRKRRHKWRRNNNADRNKGRHVESDRVEKQYRLTTDLPYKMTV